MRRVAMRGLALALLLAGSAAQAKHKRAAAPAEPPVKVETTSLEDGSTLWLLRQPGAKRASFRYVVRAGSLKDPEGKVGLAHLLEHLIFHGSYDSNGAAFRHAVREAGGNYNAYTSADSTVYVLDVDRSAFPGLVEQYLHQITDPALTLAHLDEELGVISSEDLFHGHGAGFSAQLEAMLFPAAQGNNVIGAPGTRQLIMPADLVQFFASNYTPANTTVVVVGDLGLDEARALVEKASRLAPTTGAGSAPPPHTAPELPIQEQAFSPATFAALGYPLETSDPLLCRDLAELLELRLQMRVLVKDAMASGATVECIHLRGNYFVVALAYTRSFEGSELGDTMREVLLTARDEAPKRAELDLLTERSQHYQAELRRTPDLCATSLAQAAALPRDQLAAAQASFTPFHLDAKQARAAVSSSFTQEREISLSFSPFRQ